MCGPFKQQAAEPYVKHSARTNIIQQAPDICYEAVSQGPLVGSPNQLGSGDGALRLHDDVDLL